MKLLPVNDDDFGGDIVPPGDLAAMSDEEVGLGLMRLMSAISEERYFAGWHTAIEAECRRACEADPNAVASVSAAHPEAPMWLRAYRERLAGGWVAWVAAKSYSATDPDPIFLLTADEWTIWGRCE